MNMRSIMLLIEGQSHFLGTCVNCFDEDGDCVVPGLPWSSVSDFALADENASVISPENFNLKVVVPPEVKNATAGHDCRYLDLEGVPTLYDADDDIHYFFGAS